MSYFLLDTRSDNDYGESESDGVESSFGCSDILWLPVAFVLVFLIGAVPFLALTAYFLYDVYTTTRRTMYTGELSYPFLAGVGAIAP